MTSVEIRPKGQALPMPSLATAEPLTMFLLDFIAYCFSQGLPPQFTEYLAYCRSLKFGAETNVSYLQVLTAKYFKINRAVISQILYLAF